MKSRASVVLVFRLVSTAFGLFMLICLFHEIGTRSLVAPYFSNPSTWIMASTAVWCISMFTAFLSSYGPTRRKAAIEGLASTWMQALASLVVASLYTTENAIPLTLFILTCLHISVVGTRMRALVAVLLTGAAHAFAWYLSRGELHASLAILLSLTIGAIGYRYRLDVDEWERLNILFDQSRKAASEFVSINTRMQDSIDRNSSMARLRERSRIAREIHDSVGYVLTAVLVQIVAAQEVLRANPLQLLERLKKLEDLVRDSIQEVRREVSELRDESVLARVGTSRWTRMCEAFADGTGITIHTVMCDDLEIVDQEISETVYRIIQESLTNAYRHGGADYVDVSMAWENHCILLRVSDNGKGNHAVAPGNGLRGMRERVAAFGGTVSWITMPERGFDLGVEIPWGREE